MKIYLCILPFLFAASAYGQELSQEEWKRIKEERTAQRAREMQREKELLLERMNEVQDSAEAGSPNPSQGRSDQKDEGCKSCGSDKVKKDDLAERIPMIAATDTRLFVLQDITSEFRTLERLKIRKPNQQASIYRVIEEIGTVGGDTYEELLVEVRVDNKISGSEGVNDSRSLMIASKYKAILLVALPSSLSIRKIADKPVRGLVESPFKINNSHIISSYFDDECYERWQVHARERERAFTHRELGGQDGHASRRELLGLFQGIPVTTKKNFTQHLETFRAHRNTKEPVGE